MSSIDDSEFDADIEREREPVTEGARAVRLLERMELDPVTQEPRPGGTRSS